MCKTVTARWLTCGHNGETKINKCFGATITGQYCPFPSPNWNNLATGTCLTCATLVKCKTQIRDLRESQAILRRDLVQGDPRQEEFALRLEQISGVLGSWIYQLMHQGVHWSNLQPRQHLDKTAFQYMMTAANDGMHNFICQNPVAYPHLCTTLAQDNPAAEAAGRALERFNDQLILQQSRPGHQMQQVETRRQGQKQPDANNLKRSLSVMGGMNGGLMQEQQRLNQAIACPPERARKKPKLSQRLPTYTSFAPPNPTDFLPLASNLTRAAAPDISVDNAQAGPSNQQRQIRAESPIDLSSSPDPSGHTTQSRPVRQTRNNPPPGINTTMGQNSQQLMENPDSQIAAYPSVTEITAVVSESQQEVLDMQQRLERNQIPSFTDDLVRNRTLSRNDPAVNTTMGMPNGVLLDNVSRQPFQLNQPGRMGSAGARQTENGITYGPLGCHAKGHKGKAPLGRLVRDRETRPGRGSVKEKGAASNLDKTVEDGSTGIAQPPRQSAGTAVETQTLNAASGGTPKENLASSSSDTIGNIDLTKSGAGQLGALDRFNEKVDELEKQIENSEEQIKGLSDSDSAKQQQDQDQDQNIFDEFTHMNSRDASVSSGDDLDFHLSIVAEWNKKHGSSNEGSATTGDQVEVPPMQDGAVGDRAENGELLDVVGGTEEEK